MSEVLTDLGNNPIIGFVLFFIGLLVFYLFMRFFVRVGIHYSNRD